MIGTNAATAGFRCRLFRVTYAAHPAVLPTIRGLLSIVIRRTSNALGTPEGSPVDRARRIRDIPCGAILSDTQPSPVSRLDCRNEIILHCLCVQFGPTSHQVNSEVRESYPSDMPREKTVYLTATSYLRHVDCSYFPRCCLLKRKDSKPSNPDAIRCHQSRPKGRMLAKSKSETQKKR